MNIAKSLVFAGALVALSAGTLQANAQNRGNFDPAQMRAQMLERIREQFDVKNDDEWKLISTRISTVMDIRRETGGFGGGFGFRGPRPSGDTAGGGGGGNGGGTRGGFGGTPNPDVEALQKAIEVKAPNDEIKAKLARVRETRKSAEAKLDKAQDDLRAVLTVRQEAQAVLFGLLK
ncbi:MAG: hypothetical protein HY300_11090 [Verrucomicrobia bacterium]|nr:hypothetical protein [Verrucomicrobiota bacterium]